MVLSVVCDLVLGEMKHAVGGVGSAHQDDHVRNLEWRDTPCSKCVVESRNDNYEGATNRGACGKYEPEKSIPKRIRLKFRQICILVVDLTQGNLKA